MKVTVDRLDHLAPDEILASRTLRSEQHVEIVLAILATLEFVVLIVLVEWPKTLRTNKAVLMPDVSSWWVVENRLLIWQFKFEHDKFEEDLV